MFLFGTINFNVKVDCHSKSHISLDHALDVCVHILTEVKFLHFYCTWKKNKR